MDSVIIKGVTYCPDAIHTVNGIDYTTLMTGQHVILNTFTDIYVHLPIDETTDIVLFEAIRANMKVSLSGIYTLSVENMSGRVRANINWAILRETEEECCMPMEQRQLIEDLHHNNIGTGDEDVLHYEFTYRGNDLNTLGIHSDEIHPTRKYNLMIIIDFEDRSIKIVVINKDRKRVYDQRDLPATMKYLNEIWRK